MAPSGASSGEQVSRRWPARGQRAASTRSAYWPGEEDDRKEEVGWAESARPPGKWASGKSLLPFLFLSVFYFCYYVLI